MVWDVLVVEGKGKVLLVRVYALEPLDEEVRYLVVVLVAEMSNPP